ncbi:hypothetical protein HanRHA438_Chr15g0720591 [Helianthus annuus]|uniref:Uncharacterized protein n=1 Tax=Helianthus annuus TaxID=4232 RepID=A0A9K3E3X5_HELAN|nr:hypothetical protein HanXRQr2_Chr15g0708381 [Helianthus annuus]KAJ0832547.1 hypothetical protein HanPSC8_Chr15g0679981 [Helianthus annuus]KAJ0846058.1 hypothetical protein HanRHA438_Chr15g0720591 [Helianthus annuus]
MAIDNNGLKDELLEPVYHENCPGCKVDRDKRMQTGFPSGGSRNFFHWVHFFRYSNLYD